MKKWFKRVISGALAIAMCSTSLFGGVDFGVFKASALDSTKYTNLQTNNGATPLTNQHGVWISGQALSPHYPYTYSVANVTDTTEVFCIQKGCNLGGAGIGYFQEATPTIVATQWKQEAIAEICYLGQRVAGNFDFRTLDPSHTANFNQLVADRYVAMQCLVWETVGAEFDNNGKVTSAGSNRGRNEKFEPNTASGGMYYRSAAYGYTNRAGQIYDWISTTMINRRKVGAVTADASTGKVYTMTRSGSNYTITIPLSELRQDIPSGTYGKAFTEQVNLADTIKVATGWNCTQSGSSVTVTVGQSYLAPNSTKTFTYTRGSTAGVEFHEYHNTYSGFENRQKLAWGNRLDPIQTRIVFKAPAEEKGGFTFQKNWQDLDDRTTTDAVKKSDIKQLDANARFYITNSSGTILSFTGSAGNYTYNTTSAERVQQLKLKQDNSGKMTVNGLPAGTYKINEVVERDGDGNSKGYVRATATYENYRLYFRPSVKTVTVTAGKVTDYSGSPMGNTVGVQNTRLYAYKYDDNRKPLQGAKYELYVGYIAEDGKWHGSDVRAPYLVNGKQTTLVDGNGVKWVVGTKVRTATSDENGLVDFGSVPAFWYLDDTPIVYEYSIKEVSAPTNYALNNKQQYVLTGRAIPNVDRGNKGAVYTSKNSSPTSYFTFTDTPQNLIINVTKVDDENRKLQGAVFGLYANQDSLKLFDLNSKLSSGSYSNEKTYAKDELIAQGTSNNSGEITFGDSKGRVTCSDGKVRTLLSGKYYVKEISPPKNYVKNNSKYEFTLQSDKTSTQVTFHYYKTIPNTHKTGEVTVIKKGYNNKPLAGAEFILYPTDKGVVINGEKYEAGDKENPIAKGSTDTNGRLVFSVRVPTGYRYTVEETKAPTGYALSSDSSQTFDLTDDSALLTYIPVSKEFQNKPQTVDVKVLKSDSTTQKVLTGAVFDLYANETFTAADGTSYTKGVRYAQSKPTNGNGKAQFFELDKNGNRTETVKYLPAGHKFYVVETVAPTNYELDKTKKYFTTRADRASKTIVLEQEKAIPNDFQYAAIAAYKQDDTTNEPLDGAVFALISVNNIYLAPNVKLYEAGQEIARATTGKSANEIYTPGLAVFTDKDGEEIAFPVGYDYIIKEISPPKGYNGKSEQQQFHITGVPSKEYVEVKKTFKNDMKPLKVVVNKEGTDGVKTTALAGVKFQLKATQDTYRPDGVTLFAKKGDVIEEKTTAINSTTKKAEIHFKDVPICDKNGKSYKYQIVETEVPKGYILDSTPIPVEAAWNAAQNVKSVTVTKNVTNDWDTVSVSVKKVDEDTATPLSGAKYALYANEDIKYVDGTSRWAKDKQIAVSEETNDKGIAIFKDAKGNTLKIPANRKYYIKEVKAPTNYVRKINWKYEFTANKNGTATAPTVTQKNTPKPLSVTVEKVDKDTTIPLEGAVFTLYADETFTTIDGQEYTKGQRLQSITTKLTADGKKAVADFDDVPLGHRYKVVETKAPANYNNFINEKLERPTWTVNVQDDGGDTTEIKHIIKATNEWQEGIIRVYKTSADTNEPLAGAVFRLYKVNDDGTKTKIEDATTKIVKNADTGKDEGIATFSKQKVGSKYAIEEIKAPYGYVRSTEIRTFTLGYTATQYYASKSESFTNKWQEGDITVFKYSLKNGEKIPLANAEFTLYALEDVKIGANTTKYYANSHSINADNKVVFAHQNTSTKTYIIQTVKTDDNGNAKFDKVPTGYKYAIVETQAPAGYKNAHPSQTLTLSYDEKIEFKELTTSEINTETELYISKQTLTGKKPLEGATLQLIRVSDSKVIREWKSAANEGEYFSKLVAGKYILREIAAPDGFVIATDIPFTMNDKGEVTASDDVTINYKGETPIIVMFDETTKVNISKVDITTKEELKGAKLTVTDKVTGNVVESWTSNGSAHLIEGKLIVGKTYVLTEIAAPEGYLISNSIEFVVKGRNTTTGKYEVQTVTMEDDYTHTEISKVDITTGKALIGAHLILRNSKGEIVAEWTTDGSVKKLYRLAKGWYTLEETAAPDGYLISETVRFEVKDSKGTDGKPVINKVTMKDDYTKLSILKIDAETKKPLVGAKLQLLDSQGNILVIPDGKGGTILCEWITDGTEKTFYRIPEGTYTLHEVSAPAGYVKFKDQKITITKNDYIEDGKVNPNKVKKVTVEDAIIQVEVDKTSITDGKKVIGAHLVIKDSKGNVYDEWDVTEKAHIIKRMPTGVYTLTETFAPAGYVIANTITFTVEETGEIQKVHMVDDITKLEISKYRANAKDGEDKNLAGAKLQLIDKQTGNIVDEWTTDGTAHKIYEKLVAGRTYTLHEVSAPDGYCVADDKDITISLDGKVDKISLTDDTTKVELSKKQITGDEELEGARLQVIDTTNDKVVEEWTSGKTAHYIEAKLIAGRKYILRETISPKGFVIANDVTFTVSKKGKVDKVTMRDDTTKVDISKKSVVTGKELSGAVLAIYEGDTLVEQWTTTDETHYIEAKLEAGHTYRLVEISAPKGYKITEEIEFTVSTDGSVDKVEMIDDIQTGHLTIYKKTPEQKNIENIEFRLFGTSLLGVKVDVTAKTNRHGVVKFKDIPIGNYKISENGETVHPAYLIPDDKDTEITVDETTTIEWENTEKLGNAEIHKVTEEGKNIENIEFTLSGVSDTGRKIKLTGTTDANGIVEFKNIPIGKYTLAENGKTVNKAYIVAKDQIVEVNYAKTTKVNVENEEKKGSIKVQKKTEGMVNLEGIEFTLSGTSETGRAINRSAKTDKYGVAIFENLPIGNYTVKENADTVNKAYAYIIAEQREVAVLYGEQTLTEFYNAEKQGEIEITKRTEENKNIEGIEFILEGTSETGREIRLTAKTDENGKALFEKVPIGNYTVTENGETVPEAYLTAEPKTVNVRYEHKEREEFFNQEKKGSIEIQKKTEGMINLEGINFILEGTSDSGRVILVEAKTDANGKCEFTDIPIGTYVIKEDGATVPAAYLVADETSVTVTYAESTNVTIENKERTGTIQIKKKTEGMLNIKDIKMILEGTSDSGREIRLEVLTDKDGIATFDNLPIGTYVVKEDGATVPEGYLVADEFTVTCVYAQTTTKEIFNEEKCGSIELHKTTEGMLNIKGIKFHLTGVSDAGRAINLETVTDEKGIAKFDKVPVGTYMITEDGATTPIAYMVADKKECKVMYSEMTTVEIKNQEKTGSIKVQKKTEGMTDIAGIKFHLTGKSDSGRAINLEAITDANGVADFGQVPVGTYVISEDGSTVPTAYLVADDQECKAVYAESTTVVFVNQKKPTEDRPPQTGYNHPIGLLLPAMLVSLAGIAVFSKKRKEE